MTNRNCKSFCQKRKEKENANRSVLITNISNRRDVP